MMTNRLQGAIFTIMVVRVVDPYDPALEREIAQEVALSPRFCAGAPAVIDLGDCLGCIAEADFEALKQLLRKHSLVAVGVQNASPVQRRLAAAAGPAALGLAFRGSRRGSSESAEPRAAQNGAAGKTRLVTQPVRSGAQIYARGGDLI